MGIGDSRGRVGYGGARLMVSPRHQWSEVVDMSNYPDPLLATRECLACASAIPRRGVLAPRYTRLAALLLTLGAVVAAAGIAIAVAWVSAEDTRRVSLKGYLVAAALGSLPGFAIGAFGIRLPKVCRVVCRKCGWSEVLPQGRDSCSRAG